MWHSFLEFIFSVLQWLQVRTGDYGIAIVLLTVVIRVLLIPLTVQQTKSAYELQRIQPKIKELQAKHKNDKEKLQEETLKFYQENKVNPFGGCLPLILQMPVFIGLFNVLGGTEKKPGLLLQHLSENPAVSKAFRLGVTLIPDITMTPAAVWASKNYVMLIPYAIIVLLFALSVWLPQQLGPGDQQQKRMGLYMSAMMLYFGWISAAGVLIYWVTSSAWQLAQQAIIQRSLNKDEEGSSK